MASVTKGAEPTRGVRAMMIPGTTFSISKTQPWCLHNAVSIYGLCGRNRSDLLREKWQRMRLSVCVSHMRSSCNGCALGRTYIAVPWVFLSLQFQIVMRGSANVANLSPRPSQPPRPDRNRDATWSESG